MRGREQDEDEGTAMSAPQGGLRLSEREALALLEAHTMPTLIAHQDRHLSLTVEDAESLDYMSLRWGVPVADLAARLRAAPEEQVARLGAALRALGSRANQEEMDIPQIEHALREALRDVVLLVEEN